jgi:hypothetical protein
MENKMTIYDKAAWIVLLMCVVLSVAGALQSMTYNCGHKAGYRLGVETTNRLWTDAMLNNLFDELSDPNVVPGVQTMPQSSREQKPDDVHI